MMRESFIVLMVNVSLARGEINGQVGFWKKVTNLSLWIEERNRRRIGLNNEKDEKKKGEKKEEQKEGGN